MGILRNSINITGITPENKLPRKISGQLLEYSEIEHIYTPEDKPRIHTIHQISIKLETQIGRTINSPTGKILILDGIRKLKLVYTQRSKPDKSIVVNLQLPFNTFIDIPNNSGEIKNIDVHVADAYFSQVGVRKLYSHLLYMINIDYETHDTFNAENDTDIAKDDAENDTDSTEDDATNANTNTDNNFDYIDNVDTTDNSNTDTNANIDIDADENVIKHDTDNKINHSITQTDIVQD